MNAAIYARKSTEQHGVADEQKSVSRQIEHAREFAATKGGRSPTSTSTSMTASAAPSSPGVPASCG
jgi:DNA invertase Pin-like site-specific DNA recombinase